MSRATRFSKGSITCGEVSRLTRFLKKEVFERSKAGGLNRAALTLTVKFCSKGSSVGRENPIEFCKGQTPTERVSQGMKTVRTLRGVVTWLAMLGAKVKGVAPSSGVSV